MPRPYARTEQVQTTLRRPDKKQLDAFAKDRISSRADAMQELILEGLEARGYTTFRQSQQ